MHRLIMNELKNLQVDHIDGNKLNNTKINLRIVTNQQNCMNQKSSKNSSSKFKGVYWHKKNMKWISKICLNEKNHYLGSFNNEIDAARAHDKEAKKLHNIYAYLNEV